MLIVDGIKYRLLTPKDEEKDFHPLVKEQSKRIFGEKSLYFDVKHKIKSKSGIAGIPDAYVISLSKPHEWYIVENELASHQVYKHIVPQVSRFVDGIANLESQREIRDILLNEIERDKLLQTFLETNVDLDGYRFLTELLSKPPRIVIMINEITPEVDQAKGTLRKLAETEIIEFKTFVREDAENVRAHLFEPLYTGKEAAKKVEDRGKPRRPLAEHYKSWEKMLEWVDPSTRDLVELLKSKILETHNDLNRAVHGRYFCFYRGKPHSQSIFAALLLSKSNVKVRIRTDPKTFKDPQKWTGSKVYRGWFFKQGQEREFRLSNKEQLDYALELVSQSHELAKFKEAM